MCLGQADRNWKTDVPARVTYLRERKREREKKSGRGALMDRGPRGRMLGPVGL